MKEDNVVRMSYAVAPRSWIEKISVLFATIGLAACEQGQSPLPLGAYGRAAEYEMACRRYEGLQRADEAFALGGVDAYKRVLSVLWESGSCISFSKGDPIFFEGVRQNGFVKVGPTKSDINYFAPSKILNGPL